MAVKRTGACSWPRCKTKGSKLIYGCSKLFCAKHYLTVIDVWELFYDMLVETGAYGEAAIEDDDDDLEDIEWET